MQDHEKRRERQARMAPQRQELDPRARRCGQAACANNTDGKSWNRMQRLELENNDFQVLNSERDEVTAERQGEKPTPAPAAARAAR